MTRQTKRERLAQEISSDLAGYASEWDAALPKLFGSERVRRLFVEALSSARLVRGPDFEAQVGEAMLASVSGFEATGIAIRAHLPSEAHPLLDEFAAHCMEFARIASGVASEAKFVPGLVMAQESVARQAAGTKGAKKRGEPVREAARSYIRVHPDTSLSACARHVAEIMAKDERDVRRMISELFEPGAGRGKRPRRG